MTVMRSAAMSYPAAAILRPSLAVAETWDEMISMIIICCIVRAVARQRVIRGGHLSPLGLTWLDDGL